MSDAVRDIFADWSLPIWFTLVLILTGLIYLRGWLVIRRTRPEQFTDLRLSSFLGGLTVLWLAVGSPMDGFADALLSAHMVEHLLLMSVVPPMLLYGLPVVPLLRGLPRPVRLWIAGPLLRQAPLRRLVHWLGIPVVAWIAMNGTYLGWHIPSAYDFALENENWHAFEHLCILWTSILFWWCIMRPWPAETRKRGWGIILYLVMADIVNTLLCAFLAFCDRPVYSYYVEHPNPFKISPMDDQMLGAAFMWVLGSIIFLVPVMVITLRLLGISTVNRLHAESESHATIV